MYRRQIPTWRKSARTFAVAIAALATAAVWQVGATSDTSIRFATFNASLYRSEEGQLMADLRGNDAQARAITEIVQRVRPDVLLINEFDYDSHGTAAELLRTNYLRVGQNGAEPIEYPYMYVAPSNTGVYTRFGQMIGYGLFEGQYGMLLLSVYPIDHAHVRTFRNFLWQDMPGALLPRDPDTGSGWYSAQELSAMPLSSKSHWDIPILMHGQTVHVLASHPTPPSFDGPEDANGRRNHDEIRFWADYISGSAYIYDDAGCAGGLEPGSRFVIMGDENADPVDGDSTDNAILQLLDSPLINTSVTPTSDGAAEQSALQGGINVSHRGDPHHDTADWGDEGTCGNLRADYVLPSATLDTTDAGVFWPRSTDPLFRLVGTYPFPSSDHRLVWVDVKLPAAP
jgi:hypothetical protein